MPAWVLSPGRRVRTVKSRSSPPANQGDGQSDVLATSCALYAQAHSDLVLTGGEHASAGVQSEREGVLVAGPCAVVLDRASQWPTLRILEDRSTGALMTSRLGASNRQTHRRLTDNHSFSIDVDEGRCGNGSTCREGSGC